MKRFLASLLLIMVTIATFGCGSDEEPWRFEDRDVVFVEDVVVSDQEREGERDDRERDEGPDEVPRDEPDVADFSLPDYLDPSESPATCADDLTEYTVPSVIEGRLRSGRGTIDEHPCAQASGLERQYRLVIDEPTDVRIWSNYQDTEFSPVLHLQAGCGENTADLYCSSPLYSHPGEANASIRARLERGVYTLTLDERNNLGFGEGGRFKIFIEQTELANNGVCEQAESLAPGALPTVSEPGTGSSGSLAGCFTSNTPSRYWKVRMPARTGARIRAEYLDPNLAYGPAINVREACTEFCEGPHGSGEVSLANTADEPTDYVVAITDNREEPYRLWVEGFSPLADNSACETATRLEPNEYTRGNPIEGSAHAPLCSGDEVRQLYYEVEVPPNHRLLTQSPGVNMVAYSSCEERTCLFNPRNTSNSRKSYILAAGNSREVPFSLSPRVVPVAQHSSCDSALPLGLNQREWGYSTRGGESRGTCSLVFAEGFTLWYSATIPAGATYQVEVERIDGPQFNVEVLDGGCGGACAENWDAYFHGQLDPVVPIVNESDTPREVLIAVTPDGQSTRADASFTVELSEVP